MALTRRIVIGLTGPFGAGCSEIASDLETRLGWRSYSLSNAMRDIASKEIQDVDMDKLYSPKKRSYQQDIGNQIRAKNVYSIAAKVGDDITAHENANHLLSVAPIVIDGIRNPAEMIYFRDRFPHFFSIAVFAPKGIRWLRKRDVYEGDQAAFEVDDSRDAGDSEPAYGQAVQLCVDRSDILVSNEKQFTEPRVKQDLQDKIELYVSLMRRPGSMLPHNWELVMGQAYHSSLMSTCCKRRVGAVIIKEDVTDRQSRSYVIASGYNEAPINIRTCSQRGGRTDPWYCHKDEKIKDKLKEQYQWCPRCGEKLDFAKLTTLPFICPKCHSRLGSDFIPGRMLDLCIAVHAEEAALLQAARFGATAVDGSVLYTTTFPCPLCAKMIVQSGIRKILFAEPYPQAEAVDILGEAGIPAELFEGVKGRAYCGFR